MAGHSRERTRSSARLAAVPKLDAALSTVYKSTSPQRRGTKRKNNGTLTPKNGERKSKRMKFGVCYLATMPLDIVYEIFSHLSVDDLSQLAKIRNKNLYTLLTEPASKSLWKKARAKFVPPMPDCPSGMKEHVFATLLLSDVCQYCYKKPPSEEMVREWFAQRLICHNCVFEHCRPFPNYSDTVATPLFLRKLFARKGSGRSVNTVSFNDYLPITYIPDDRCYYFVEYFKIWEAQVLKMETVDERWEWLQKKKPRANAKMFVRTCNDWRSRYMRIQEHERKLRVQNRQARVLEYTRSIGWSEEIDKKHNSEVGVEALPEIVALCQNDITERRLQRFKSVIENHMLRIKSRRLARERKDLLSLRLPTQSFMTSVELFLEPSIQDIIFNTPPNEILTEAHLLPTIVEIVPEASRRQRQRIEEELLEIVQNSRISAEDPTPIDRHTTLNLATTVFRCKLYNCLTYKQRHFISAEDAVLHPCIMQKYIPNTFEDSACIQNYLGPCLRSPSVCLIVEKETATGISELVKACGLDPLTATKQSMDELDPIFECVNCCEHPLKGRPMGSWATMANHYKFAHYEAAGTSSFEPRRLTGDEEVAVRAQMAQKIIREWNDPYCNVLACMHCGKSETDRFNLDNHIRNMHNKEKLTTDDIMLSPAGVHTPGIYYMWPPRSDEYTVILNFMK